MCRGLTLPLHLPEVDKIRCDKHSFLDPSIPLQDKARCRLFDGLLYVLSTKQGYLRHCQGFPAQANPHGNSGSGVGGTVSTPTQCRETNQFSGHKSCSRKIVEKGLLWRWDSARVTLSLLETLPPLVCTNDPGGKSLVCTASTMMFPKAVRSPMGERQGNVHHDEFQKMTLPRDGPATRNTSQTGSRPLSVISLRNQHYFTLRTVEAFTDAPRKGCARAMLLVSIISAVVAIAMQSMK